LIGTNLGWLLAEKIVRWLVGLSVAALVARHLGPADYGRLNLALAFSALFVPLAGAGIETLLTRDIVRSPAQASEMIATVLFVRLAAGLASFLLMMGALLGSSGMGMADLPTAMVVILSSGLILQAGDVFDLWFQSQVKARPSVLARSLSFLVFSGVRLILVANEAPVAAFAWALAGEAALTAAGLGLLYATTGGSPGPWRFVRERARRLIAEAWPNLVSALAIAVYTRADRLVLGHHANEETLGLYGAAATLAEVWYILPTALVATMNPALTREHGGDPARFWERLRQVVQGLALVGWILVAVLGLAAGPLITALFGAKFAGATSLLPIMMISTLFAFIGVGVSPWYHNEGAMRLALRRHLLGAAVGVALNLILVPLWGAPGAAWATAAAFATAHWWSNAIDARTRPLFRLQTQALLFGSLSSLKPSVLFRR
jgi:PST family polysaccharide transporter